MASSANDDIRNKPIVENKEVENKKEVKRLSRNALIKRIVIIVSLALIITTAIVLYFAFQRLKEGEESNNIFGHLFQRLFSAVGLSWPQKEPELVSSVFEEKNKIARNNIILEHVEEEESLLLKTSIRVGIITAIASTGAFVFTKYGGYILGGGISNG